MYSDKVVPAIKEFLRKRFVVLTFILYVISSLLGIIYDFLNSESGMVGSGMSLIFLPFVILTYVLAVNKDNETIDTALLNMIRRFLILNIVSIALLFAMSFFSAVGKIENLLVVPIVAVLGAIRIFASLKGIEFVDSIICAVESSYPDTSAPRIVGVLQFAMAPLSILMIFIGEISVLSVIMAAFNCVFNVCFGFVLLQYIEFMKELRREIIEEDSQKTTNE